MTAATDPTTSPRTIAAVTRPMLDSARRAGRDLRYDDRPLSAAAATMPFVPRISEFYGIVVAMYYREHGVPHFHATYAGETVVIAIQTGDVIAGNVPARALRLVQEWSALHRDELRLNWARARENAPLVRIDPLP
jgi:Domain of unknown function (DUF4160)